MRPILPAPPTKLRSLQPFMWSLLQWMSLMDYPEVEDLKVKLYKATKTGHRRQVLARAFRIIAREARCRCTEMPHYPHCPTMVLVTMEEWANAKWRVNRSYNQRSPHQALIGAEPEPEPEPEPIPDLDSPTMNHYHRSLRLHRGKLLPNDDEDYPPA